TDRSALLHSLRRCIQAPRPRHSLQLPFAAVLESQARAGDEVFDGLRDEHLARPGGSGDACPDRDGQARNLAVVELALARVDTGAHLESESMHAFHDGLRAADRARGAVERCEEAVACSVPFFAAEPPELPADERMMLVEELPP